MVRGSLKESYTLLTWYGEVLEISNLGTQYDLEMKSDGHFKYVYMALRAFIRGFLNCIRLVVVVNATHCKGKYKGIMLVPVSIDANKQVCPIAFGLGDKEINESWTWFIRRLQITITTANRLVIVLDHHKSIAKFIPLVFPDNSHALVSII